VPVNSHIHQHGHGGGWHCGIWGGIGRGNPNDGGGRFGSKGGIEGGKTGL
jgi:hypothetical protein